MQDDEAPDWLNAALLPAWIPIEGFFLGIWFNRPRPDLTWMFMG